MKLLAGRNYITAQSHCLLHHIQTLNCFLKIPYLHTKHNERDEFNEMIHK